MNSSWSIDLYNACVDTASPVIVMISSFSFSSDVCGRCVFRFDHHCSWIHCCIGANNYRYFIGLLLTTIMMTTNGVAMCSYALRSAYTMTGLHSYKHISADGSAIAPHTLLLIQVLSGCPSASKLHLPFNARISVVSSSCSASIQGYSC